MTKQIISKIVDKFAYFNNSKEKQTMHILLIGSGGREHSLAWKIASSTKLSKLFIAPGNAGTLQYGTNLQIDIKDNDSIVQSCIQHQIDMVIVGPEEPLVNGVYDAIKNNPKTSAIQVIGPSKFAAQLEGSKSFAKQFMDRNNIPTAGYKEFDKNSFTEGVAYLKTLALPIVLKADGLAGGKGVVICATHIEAIAEFEMMLLFSKFGEAGNKVVVEEFLDGIEFSVFAITDGETYKILPIAKDYKRIGEGDTGLNTGGMGAISPVPFVDEALYQKVIQKIVEPTIFAFAKEKIVYKGFVFFGLIKVGEEPFVIEYNCRLGDPETEVILPRLKNDLLDIFIHLYEGKLGEIVIEEDPRVAVTIVAASGGYPKYYNTGYTINGLAYKNDHTDIFISGAIMENNEVKTNGGRVLAVTSMGKNIEEASANSKLALESIGFEEMYYRKDIGYEFLN